MTPLPATAAAGRGPVGEALAAKAPDRALRFEDWTVVTAAADGPDELPWVDGVVYLGPLPGALDLLVPVHRPPALHPDLLRHAVRAVVGTAGRAALLPDDDDGGGGGDGMVVLPLGEG